MLIDVIKKNFLIKSLNWSVWSFKWTVLGKTEGSTAKLDDLQLNRTIINRYAQILIMKIILTDIHDIFPKVDDCGQRSETSKWTAFSKTLKSSLNLDDNCIKVELPGLSSKNLKWTEVLKCSINIDENGRYIKSI